MGFFKKLLGGKDQGVKEASAQAAPEEPDLPDAVVVLRRGTNIPDAEYVAKVLAGIYPAGLPDPVKRAGLSQPSWYKTEEVADAITASVAETFGPKLGVGDAQVRRHATSGPDGCPCLVVELRRAE